MVANTAIQGTTGINMLWFWFQCVSIPTTVCSYQRTLLFRTRLESNGSIVPHIHFVIASHDNDLISNWWCWCVGAFAIASVLTYARSQVITVLRLDSLLGACDIAGLIAHTNMEACWLRTRRAYILAPLRYAQYIHISYQDLFMCVICTLECV